MGAPRVELNRLCSEGWRGRAVGAGELCQLIIGGMRDRGCDLRTIAIEIAARDGPPDEANWTAHLTTNESVSCADNKAFIYAYAEVRRGYDLLTD